MARKRPKLLGTIPDLLTLIGRGVHDANEDLEILDLQTLVKSKGKDLVPRVMAFTGGKVKIRSLATIDKRTKQVKLFGLGDSSESDRNDQFELEVDLDLVVVKPTKEQMELVDQLSEEDADRLVADRKLDDAAKLAESRFEFDDEDPDADG